MKRYKRYKDSGVEWIGEIPEEWEVKKIKHLSQVKRGASPRPIDDMRYFDENGEYAWVRISDVTNSKVNLNYTEQRLSKLGASKSVKLNQNSIFISICATVGKPIISNIKCCIHDGFVYFPEYKRSNKFLYYIFESKKPYEGLGKMGTQLNLNTETVGNIFIPFMNKKEEEAIVSYLDHKTSQLEALISKKQELIETLKASRTKLISETVTKGLDKDVEMKDSGVEWIGEIPRHWEVNRLKFICDINPQKSEVRLSKSSKVSFIPMENISLNTLNLDTEKELREVYGGYTYFRDGDIIFAKVTPCFENGNMSIVRNLTNGVGFGSTELNVLRVNEKIIDREFLYYIIQSDKFKNQAIANMYGVAGLKRISTKFIEDYHILLPSINEQKKIIEFLNIKIEYIDKIISKTEEQITLLKKAKQKLITEVVTGKIDVTDL